jgi:hypothetical protein
MPSPHSEVNRDFFGSRARADSEMGPSIRQARDGLASAHHQGLSPIGGVGPAGDALLRAGFIPASHENAAAALRSGGVLFPGGDFDVYRSTSDRNTIDFNGRTGYVRAEPPA